MTKTYSIGEKEVRNIVSQVIKNSNNNDNIVTLLIETLESDHLTVLINMILSNDKYTPLQRGKFYTWVPESYDSKKWDLLKLQDLGLLEGNSIYGKLKDSDNYGSEFKPFHNKMIMDALVTNDEGDVILKEVTVPFMNLTEVIDTQKIQYLRTTKYFNLSQSHIKDEV